VFEIPSGMVEMHRTQKVFIGSFSVVAFTAVTGLASGLISL
jgi:hypothetical protein